MMYGGVFFCLGFSVDHEHSLEVTDGSYSHRLKPKDENLSELFIPVFANETPSPGRNSRSLGVYPCILKTLFCYILSQLRDEPFPGAAALPRLLGDGNDGCRADEELFEQTHCILTVCVCCSSWLPSNSRSDNFSKCWF